MARTVPVGEPTELTAGDSWEWDRVVADFPPSDGWTLTYYFNGPAAFNFAAATSSSGDYFEVRENAAANDDRAAGAYKVLGRVTDGTDAFTVFEGMVVVLANLVGATASQSHDARTLAILDAAIEGRLTADLEEYQINGRAVKKIPMAELLKMQGIYRSRVARERNGGRWGRVEVSFGLA